MKPLSAFLGLAGLAVAVAASSVRRDYEQNDYYVLHLDGETVPDQVALQLGLVHEGQLGELAGHHVFSGHKSGDDVVRRELQQRRRRRRSISSLLSGRSPLDGVLFAQKQQLHRRLEKRVIPPMPPSIQSRQGERQAAQPEAAAVQRQALVASTLDIQDPIFKEQWHLFNTQQVGHDVNVTDVWLQGITGHNTTVSIVDDGLDMYSDDLKDNYYAKGSYDFNEQTAEPRPRLSDDRHGTRCAGEVSAVRNNVCGVGVAYDSRISGIRILSKAISDADEAAALNYDYQNNDIYSCSWGPPDDGRSMDAPGVLIRRAMLNAVQNGRGGLGSIYVFASGNGAASDDNCNFDGYTNSIYSITVGAVDRKGDHPFYSEKCSASLVVTYSSGGGDAIHTTDVGQNACYNGHGGTSAAAPLAAGIFALALQIRPDLTWRDMQYLVLMTAVPINLDSGDWQDTFIGRKYSHTFAYGKVDSYALVEAAKTWTNVKPQAWFYSPWIHVHEAIPQGDVGLTVSLEITEAMLQAANFARVEHVTVTMNIDHTRRGDLSVDLISPNNVVSHLSVTRKPDNTPQGYVDWTFMSVVHWGETGVGTWTVVVKDTIVNNKNGTFTDFHLKLWGESIDGSKAQLLPMPTEEDDNDHDITATTTLAASTTTLQATSSSSTFAAPTEAVPTDQPGRPVKPTAETSGSSSATTTTTAGSPAEATGDKTEHESEEESSSPTPTGNTTSWMPAFMANMSTKKQIWIYGAMGLIVAFCLGLGVYLFLARRQRLRNSPRDNYEFELLDEEEAEALNGSSGGGGDDDRAGGRLHVEKTAAGIVGGLVGSRKSRRKATRGGELYDAFADGSDEEDDDGDDGDDRLSHRDEARYDETGYASRPQVGYRDGSDEKLQQPREDRQTDAARHVIGEDSDESQEESEDSDDETAAGHSHDRSQLL
ncbi:pheromone processing endoprotease kex2 [Grosmannia clavigera kw1407]|uniref:Pheromone processing endoprotease kex2 n=1 Tax=Grosmannia clavigera (strain kw1407 / UAMH 11150) TaxID=655863 RepID=F0XS58_GROCL|nr:pheromone processing endoprotease kex2 [Grosmannia clavigera kw1407]EFW99397.1 pheromone processing endoprotease kex2 [Grosmannia clavigera kw1407]